MKKLIVAMLFVVALSLATVAPAFAHVHGITPLLSCTVDNANSGGLGANGTQADSANGGPIAGLIPLQLSMLWHTQSVGGDQTA